MDGRKTAMTVGEIRVQASALLKGNWLIMMVGFVLTLVSWTIVTQILFALIGTENIFAPFQLIDGWNGWDHRYGLFIVVAVFLFILADLLHMSYRWFGLDLVDYKKEKLEVKNIFQGLHSKNRKRFIQFVLVRACMIFLWSLLFILPGIWKAYMYSQALNILKDNPTITSMDALKQSEEMMKGNVLKYVLIQVSFAPWYVIPIGLYVLFIVNNLEEIAIGAEMGQEMLEIIFGMLFSVLFMLGIVLIVFALFVEPRKMVSKQVFYRSLTQTDQEKYDEFEQELLKKQGVSK